MAIHDTPSRLPMTRGDCGDERPCPYISCRHHLFLDVDEDGSIKLNFPEAFHPDGDPNLAELPATCSLDLAASGEHTLEVVSEYFGITRERVRQVEVNALERVRLRLAARGYREGHDVDQTVGIWDNHYVDDVE